MKLEGRVAVSHRNTILAALKASIDSARYFADPNHQQEAMAALSEGLSMAADDPKLVSIYNAYHARPAGEPYPRFSTRKSPGGGVTTACAAAGTAGAEPPASPTRRTPINVATRAV